MKNQLFKGFLSGLTFAGLLFLASCEGKDYYQASKANERADLNRLKAEIEKMAGQTPCNNVADWTFVAMGAKPCGGPTHYIAYSNKIDTELFLNKVATYEAKEKAFNVKWNIASDCMLIGPPKTIECVGDKARLVY